MFCAANKRRWIAQTRKRAPSIIWKYQKMDGIHNWDRWENDIIWVLALSMSVTTLGYIRNIFTRLNMELFLSLSRTLPSSTPHSYLDACYPCHKFSKKKRNILAIISLYRFHYTLSSHTVSFITYLRAVPHYWCTAMRGRFIINYLNTNCYYQLHVQDIAGKNILFSKISTWRE